MATNYSVRAANGKQMTFAEVRKFVEKAAQFGAVDDTLVTMDYTVGGKLRELQIKIED